MGNSLSHSAISKYQTCQKAYEFHYVKRYREKTKSGALLFGSALDEAVNALLLKNGDPYAVFDKAFSFAEVGGKQQYIPTCQDVVYSSTDFDKDLLRTEDLIKLQEHLNSTNWKQGPFAVGDISHIAGLKRELGWKNLESSERQLYNLANWLSLVRKGYLMIDAYKQHIMPKIKSVKAVQRKLDLKNADGDSIVGFVDLVAEWQDGRTIILDNKTSSMEYERDAVLTSPQLSLYVHALKEEFQTRTAGFIVLRKQIIKNRVKVCSSCGYKADKGARHKTCDQEVAGKRCNANWDETIDPEVAIQILIDEIPEQMENIVMENFDSVNALVKTGVFARNFNSCEMPYGKCSFYDLCHSNDMSDIIELGPKID